MAHFPPLPFKVDKLTNQIAIDLYTNSRFYYKSGSQRIFHHWISELSPTDHINLTSLINRIKSLLRDYNRIKSSKNTSRISAFLQENFKLPAINNSTLKTLSVKETKTKELIYQLTTVKRKLCIASSNLSTLKQANKRKERQNINLKRKLGTSRTSESPKLKQKTQSCQTNTVQKKMVLEKSNQCNLLNADSIKLREEISFWQTKTLQQQEEAHAPTFRFKLKEEGRGSPYSCKVRESVYSCLQFNVSRENISPLIKEIVRIFTGEDITTLPAPSSISTMAREAGILSELQLKETLSNSNNLTLLRDATTKRGRHYYGVKLCTDTQDFTLGTKEISCGTAEQYTEAAVEMLENISSPDNPIVSKISNFMTDRSATEIKTNRLITIVIESLEEDKKTSSFHCSVHPLLQFAEEAEKVAKHLETTKNLQLNKLVFKSHGESFTQNFLRCVSKIFYDDKSGDPGFSQHFLDMVGISHIPIMKFKGNRFNTYFYNATGTFSIHQHLYKYLTSSKIRPNILQNSIIHYIRNPVILSICQAIALVCHHITTPYFHLAATTPTALQMSSVYNQLISGLDKIFEEPQIILDKNLQIFSLQHLETKKPEKTDLDSKIFEQTETTNQDTVLEAVKLICRNLSTKSKKLFGDFLNGGIYSNPSEELILSSKSCPANNITLERLMAQIDRQKTIAPNTSTSTINSKLMFKNNGTADWLKEKTEEQKNTLIVKCRKMGEEKRQRDIRDFIKIYTEKTSIIETRIKEKELKEAKSLAEKEKNILDINNLGGKWTTLDQIYSFISTCKTKKLKLNAIKCQITYRKEIQLQKVDSNSKHLFKKSLDLPELTENLKKLIQLEQTYLENRDELIEDMETDGLTIATDNHTNNIAPYIESDHNNNVPCIMDTSIPDHEVDVNEPTNYVGKHIIHIWDEGRNILTEYDGKLLDCNSATMTFRVAYWNSKKGHKFHKRLRKYELSLQEFKDDMKSGDLKIIN